MFSAVSCHQNKSYHVPVTSTFAIKISKSKTKSSYNSSFLYSRADWDEFKMELDRELIACKPEELSLENLEETISKSLIKAANKAIPISKKKNSRYTNYPLNIVSLIAHKRKLRFIYNKQKKE